jgi:hypothetical protein
VFSLGALRSRILLVTLSLFYDVAFVDRLWADPNLMKGAVGLSGIILTGATGLIHSLAVLLGYPGYPSFVAPLMGMGVALFAMGSWGRRISIGFDIKKSEDELRSRGTVLCLLGDARQSSSFIEGIMNKVQGFAGENSLKEAECYLVLATEIWIESLAKKGLNLLGEIFAERDVGEMIAGKNYVSPM